MLLTSESLRRNERRRITVVHITSMLGIGSKRAVNHPYYRRPKDILILDAITHLTLHSKPYFSVPRGLANDEFLRHGQAILASFIKEHGPLDSTASTTFLHYLYLRDAKNAFFLYEKLKQDNQNPPYFSVGTLCKQGRVLEALEACVQTQRRGIHLGIATYNTILHGLFLQGCVLEARRLFDSLERIGLSPTDVTYGIMIHGLCREGYLSDSKIYMQRMEKPNKITFNYMIYGYCKFDQIEEALKTVREMEGKGISPDGFTVTWLLDGYARRGDMEGALGVYLNYKIRVLPDLLGFVVLIRGLCYKGRMEEARSVLRELLLCDSLVRLINSVNIVDGAPCNVRLLHSLCEEGNMNEAISALTNIYEMHQAINRFKVNGGFPFPQNMGPFGNNAKTGHFCFDSYYEQCATLCFKGNVEAANNLVREMLQKLK